MLELGDLEQLMIGFLCTEWRYLKRAGGTTVERDVLETAY